MKTWKRKEIKKFRRNNKVLKSTIHYRNKKKSKRLKRMKKEINDEDRKIKLKSKLE